MTKLTEELDAAKARGNLCQGHKLKSKKWDPMY